MKQISQGAEAKIFLTKTKYSEKTIIKERISKKYRIELFDKQIRKFRTKREVKIIEKCNLLKIKVPKVYDYDLNDMKIYQEYIEGVKLRDKLKLNNFKSYIKKIAKIVAKIHSNDIIHGDLTTSNMIVKKSSSKDLSNDKIYLIDFGLSQISDKIEDKAVDIHLFRQALESKHNKFWKKAYSYFISEYKKSLNNSKQILDRLDKVESRGRNKLKK